MPVSLVGVSPLFIVNNAIFLVTGWFMILGNQQLGYYQANSPYSFLAGIAQYAGMSILGMLWMVADWMRGGPRPLQNGLRLRLLLPVALPDLCDTFFTIFGILNLGSGMFIIIFSFVTVLAALIRWIFLKKKLYWWQWLAIAAITITIIATGAGGHGGGEGGGPEETEAEAEAAAAASLQRSIGFLCTIIATTMDAIMYVCAEHALSTNPNAETEAVVARPSRDAAHTEQLGRVADPEARALLESAFELIDELKEELSSLSTKGVGQRSHAAGPVTPAEMTTVVGLVNLPLVSLYVAAYSLSGKWDTYVADPIEHNGCGGTFETVAYLWCLQSVMYWAHYLSFYWVAKQGSSVAAGVNKAIQGTTIFTLSHFFFCPNGPRLLMEPREMPVHIEGSTEIEWPIMCTETSLDAQCFDFTKGLAVVIVGLASLVYTYRPAAATAAATATVAGVSVGTDPQVPNKGYAVIGTEEADDDEEEEQQQEAARDAP